MDIKLPEDVTTPPDGLEFYGRGPLKVLAEFDATMDVAAFSGSTYPGEPGRWWVGACGDTPRYYALRVGSPQHALNLGQNKEL